MRLRGSDMSWVGDVGSAVAGFFGSAWDKIKDAVHAVVNALGAAVFAILNAVADAWGFLASAAETALGWVEAAVNELAWVAEQVWTVYLPKAFHGIADAGTALFHFSEKVVGWVQAVYDWAAKAITKAVQNVWNLVLDDVWKPLRDSVNSAWNVLSSVYNTITGWVKNPVSLVAMLFVPALNWIAGLADTVIEAVVTWAVRLFLKSIPRILHLTEDILSKVFLD